MTHTAEPCDQRPSSGSLVGVSNPNIQAQGDQWRTRRAEPDPDGLIDTHELAARIAARTGRSITAFGISRSRQRHDDYPSPQRRDTHRNIDMWDPSAVEQWVKVRAEHLNRSSRTRTLRVEPGANLSDQSVYMLSAAVEGRLYYYPDGIPEGVRVSKRPRESFARGSARIHGEDPMYRPVMVQALLSPDGVVFGWHRTGPLVARVPGKGPYGSDLLVATVHGRALWDAIPQERKDTLTRSV
jgi:hypothetical protein